MSAGQYVAGMNQKIAADKAGAASSVEVGAALARTDAQAGAAGGALSRLSRLYIDGYKNAAGFEQAVSSLGRAIDKGAVPIERVDAILVGVYRKYGMVANGADLAAAGQHQLAASVTALNAKLAMEEAALDSATNAHRRHAAAANDNGHQQRQLVFQLNDVFQSLALGMPVSQVFLQQGPQIAQIWGPNEGGVGRAFKETGNLITGVITKFPLLSGATVAAAAAFAGLTYEINKSTKASVGFGDVALASVQVLWRYLSDFLKPAIGSIGGWFQAAWDGVIAGVKFTGNLIINSFRAAFEDIKLLWNQLPNTIGAAAVGAANALIGAVQFMVQKAAEHLDKLIEGANVALSKIPGGDFTISPIGKLDFGDSKLPNTYADDLKKAVDQRGEKIKEIMGSDPLGGFYKDVREQAIKNALADEKKKGGKSARESDYERTIRRIKERTEATEQDTKVVGLSTFAIERQAAVQDMLTAAQRDGLAIGKAFANAQELINASSQNLSPNLAAERERILGVASAYANAEAAAEKAEEARRKFEDNMRFARDTARGFIDDFTGAIEEGASVWDAFAQAALSALDRIVDKLLDDVMDAIFDVKKASGGSSGGILGWFGGLFGGGGAADPWAGLRTVNAKGGVYGAHGVTAFANGGAFTNQIVDRPTLFPFAKGTGLMGEAGPEAIMPLRRDGSGRLGVSAAMGRMFAPANQNRAMRFEFHSKISVSGNGDKELMERVRLATERRCKLGSTSFRASCCRGA
ncbi:phage tail length tape measure family protein [Ensifer sp. PDNC004]|uniref:phage tail length tape measure family protein n=1 Tax=Ensifer sp. PDNC004 TaxID=2811423 RepID=UPI001963A185|nr:phage tail length tape measure family protein [Ensifer sp. PDNC004]QRY68201.1 phage tail length tape measure family protein [Ensifer sp. PDNC004]